MEPSTNLRGVSEFSRISLVLDENSYVIQAYDHSGQDTPRYNVIFPFSKDDSQQTYKKAVDFGSKLAKSNNLDLEVLLQMTG